MPGFSAQTRARILQRLVLESTWLETDTRAVLEQPLSVGRHEVRHGAALPHVSMQPQTAIHGVNHPVAARREFAIGRRGGMVDGRC